MKKNRKGITYLYQHFFGHSISKKLFFIYLVVIAVPVLIYSFFSYRLTAQQLKDDFIESQQHLNIQILQNISQNYIDMGKQLTALYSWSSALEVLIKTPRGIVNDEYFDAKQKLDANLNSLCSAGVNLTVVYLIDREGNIKYCFDNRRMYSYSNISVDELWFQETLQNPGQPYFQSPHKNQIVELYQDTDQYMISISQTIKEFAKNEIMGVVLLEKQAEDFFRSAITADQNSNNSTVIFDNSGEPVYVSKDMDESKIEKFKRIHSTPEVDSQEIIAGNEKMLCVQTHDENGGISIITSVPLSRLHDKTEYLRQITTGILAILFLFVLAISLVAAQSIVRPLKRMKALFYKMRGGDFQLQIPVSGDDELTDICIAFNDMAGNMDSLIQERSELQVLYQQSEMEALQRQVNPHFLYNTLNSIKAVIELDENDVAANMVQDLSDLFRYNMGSVKKMVKLKDELKHAEKYLALMEQRFEGMYQIQYDIFPELKEQYLPRFCLQPLVENAIQHGLSRRIDGGILRIAAQLKDDAWEIIVWDNGIGIEEGRLLEIQELLNSGKEIELNDEQKTRVGIYNVNSRIHLILGEKYGLRINSKYQEYTQVILHLPLTGGSRL